MNTTVLSTKNTIVKTKIKKKQINQSTTPFENHLVNNELFISCNSFRNAIKIRDFVFELSEHKNHFVFLFNESNNSQTIFLPFYHPLTNFLPDNDSKRQYTGSIDAIKIVILLMDNHKGIEQAKHDSRIQQCINKLIIEYLMDIANFATLYKIQPVFDYLEKLFTITNSFILYPLQVQRYFRKYAHDREMTFLKSLYNRISFEKEIDFEIFQKELVCCLYRLENEIFNEKSILYNYSSQIYNLIVQDSEKEYEKKQEKAQIFNNVYQLINAGMNNLSVTSKFMNYFLVSPNNCKFIPENHKPLPNDFNIYYQIKLPSALYKLLQINLYILAMNRIKCTPIRTCVYDDRFKDNEEIKHY